MSIAKAIGIISLLSVLLAGCYKPMKRAEEETLRKETGTEYAPQMYHSIPYEPLTQITDSNTYWGKEYINTNPITSEMADYNTNVLQPVEGTVVHKTSMSNVLLPYQLSNDSAGLAMANTLTNPFGLKTDKEGNLTEKSEKIYSEGKDLYLRMCSHCHGKTGESDGKVAEKYGGVTKYKVTLKGKNDGHVFHVLTYGKNRMPSHASQLSQEERWKIAAFVIKEFKQ